MRIPEYILNITYKITRTINNINRGELKNHIKNPIIFNIKDPNESKIFIIKDPDESKIFIIRVPRISLQSGQEYYLLYRLLSERPHFFVFLTHFPVSGDGQEQDERLS